MKKLLVVLAAVLVIASPAAAQQGIAQGKWWKRPRIAQALALSPAQTAELEKIFARSRPKLIDLKADLEKRQFGYQQAMSADTVDRKAVEAAIAAREQARARLQTELALMEVDMRQVLTPEQREKAQALRAQIRERAIERRLQQREGAESGDVLPAPPRGGASRAPVSPRPTP